MSNFEQICIVILRGTGNCKRARRCCQLKLTTWYEKHLGGCFWRAWKVNRVQLEKGQQNSPFPPPKD